MKLCRVCLAPDLTNTFHSCFENNGKIAKEIYELSSILVTELNGCQSSSLICRKCEKHVSQAAETKKMCSDSDSYFKKLTSDQINIWQKRRDELKVEITPENEAELTQEAPKDISCSEEIIAEPENEPSSNKTPSLLEVMDDDFNLDHSFMVEADKLLEASMACIDDTEDSTYELPPTPPENEAFRHENTSKTSETNRCDFKIEIDIKQEPPCDYSCISPNAETISRSSTPSTIIYEENEYVNLMNISNEKIIEMTNNIMEILPADSDDDAMSGIEELQLSEDNIINSTSTPINSQSTNSQSTSQEPDGKTNKKNKMKKTNYAKTKNSRSPKTDLGPTVLRCEICQIVFHTSRTFESHTHTNMAASPYRSKLRHSKN